MIVPVEPVDPFDGHKAFPFGKLAAVVLAATAGPVQGTTLASYTYKKKT